MHCMVSMPYPGQWSKELFGVNKFFGGKSLRASMSECVCLCVCLCYYFHKLTTPAIIITAPNMG